MSAIAIWGGGGGSGNLESRVLIKPPLSPPKLLKQEELFDFEQEDSGVVFFEDLFFGKFIDELLLYGDDLMAEGAPSPSSSILEAVEAIAEEEEDNNEKKKKEVCNKVSPSPPERSRRKRPSSSCSTSDAESSLGGDRPRRRSQRLVDRNRGGEEPDAAVLAKRGRGAEEDFEDERPKRRHSSGDSDESNRVMVPSGRKNELISCMTQRGILHVSVNTYAYVLHLAITALGQVHVHYVCLRK